jgi:hypothetical protein
LVLTQTSFHLLSPYASVTMIGVDEGLQEDVELTMISSESTSTDMTARDREQNPRERDIQEAIEKGDWTAVGATAAILASTSSTGVSNVEMDDTATMTTKDSSKNSSDRSAVSSQLDDDDSRAVELAELVNSGNWDVSIVTAFHDSMFSLPTNPTNHYFVCS